MTMVKTYCGLARLALAKGNLDGAMNYIETGLDMVEELLPKSITHAELLAVKGDIELDDTTDPGAKYLVFSPLVPSKREKNVLVLLS